MQLIQQEIDQLLAQQKYLKAMKKIKSLLKKQSRNGELYRLQGIIQLHQKQLSLAEKSFKKALLLNTHDYVAMSNLGFVYFAKNQMESAKEVLTRAITLNPVHIEANSLLANVALIMEDWILAESQYKKTLNINPNHVESLVNLGMLLKNNGDITEATSCLQKALNINPYQPDVYWALANLKSHQFSDEEKILVEQMIGQVNAPKELSALLFAQAKYLEDEGKYVASFDALKRANQVQYQTFDTGRCDWEKLLEDIKAVFTSEFIAQNQNAEISGIKPVLIAGMPRSGSTLIEQILASHSKISGASELETLGDWIAEFEKREGSNYPVFLSGFNESTFKQLAKHYKEKTVTWWNGTPCFTDKMPRNIRFAGALLMAFPEAKIIHSKRHPMDVCLSTFKQKFEKGNQYSFDLNELVSYHDFQNKLADHWKAMFPDRFLAVEYENVVADVESETGKMLDFLGFEFEEACLSFYETKRAIRTASAGQVTQKIYQSATHHYLKYGDALKELADLLGEQHGS